MEIFLICSFQHIRLATRRHVVKEELAAVQLRYCSALEKALEHKQTRGVPGKRLPKRGTALVVNNKMLQTKGSSLGAFADCVGRIRHVTSETWAGTNHVCVVTEAPTQLWRYNCKLRRLTTDAVLQTAVEAEKLEVLAFWYRPEGYLFVTTDQKIWIKSQDMIKPLLIPAKVVDTGDFYTPAPSVFNIKKFLSNITFLHDAPVALVWGRLDAEELQDDVETKMLTIDLRTGSASRLFEPNLKTVQFSDRIEIVDQAIYHFAYSNSQITKIERGDPGTGVPWKVAATSSPFLGAPSRFQAVLGCSHGLIYLKNQGPHKNLYSLVDKHTLKVLQNLPAKASYAGGGDIKQKGLQIPTKLGVVLLLFFPSQSHLDVILARPGKLSWVVNHKPFKLSDSRQGLQLVCMNRPQQNKKMNRGDLANPKSVIYTFFTLQETHDSHRFFKVRLPP